MSKVEADRDDILTSSAMMRSSSCLLLDSPMAFTSSKKSLVGTAAMLKGLCVQQIRSQRGSRQPWMCFLLGSIDRPACVAAASPFATIIRFDFAR